VVQPKITDFLQKKPRISLLDPGYDKENSASSKEKEESSAPDNEWVEEIGLEWATKLKDIMRKPYFQKSMKDVEKDRADGRDVFPKREEMFRALRLTPFDKIKVVILGEQTICSEEHASGLAYSVPKASSLSPSLRNIYRENGLNRSHGDLSAWAEQGVLLLNLQITASSFRYKGYNWESFVDYVINLISQQHEKVIWLLWGSHKEKSRLINEEKHHILTAKGSPSPLEYKTFRGNQHFKKVNEILRDRGETEIQWDRE